MGDQSLWVIYSQQPIEGRIAVNTECSVLIQQQLVQSLFWPMANHDDDKSVLVQKHACGRANGSRASLVVLLTHHTIHNSAIFHLVLPQLPILNNKIYPIVTTSPWLKLLVIDFGMAGRGGQQSLSTAHKNPYNNHKTLDSSDIA